MIVDWSHDEGPVLVESEDFKAFKLRLRGDLAARPAIPGIIFVDDANVLIAIDAVTQLPGVPDTAAWRTGFRAMVDHAETKGWIDAATNSIRAHVARVS